MLMLRIFYWRHYIKPARRDTAISIVNQKSKTCPERSRTDRKLIRFAPTSWPESRYRTSFFENLPNCCLTDSITNATI
jgi:hypothetical protein